MARAIVYILMSYATIFLYHKLLKSFPLLIYFMLFGVFSVVLEHTLQLKKNRHWLVLPEISELERAIRSYLLYNPIFYLIPFGF